MASIDLAQIPFLQTLLKQRFDSCTAEKDAILVSHIIHFGLGPHHKLFSTSIFLFTSFSSLIVLHLLTPLNLSPLSLFI
jgi:hypothetical protein